MTAEVYWFLYSGVQFASYEVAQRLLNNGVSSSFASGAISAAVATLFTYPCDLMRTRFVYQGNQKIYRHILSGMYTIARNDGVRGLYNVSGDGRSLRSGFSPMSGQYCPVYGFLFLYSRVSEIEV